MLVEDDPDILTVTARGLRMKGFEVEAFADPQEAIDNYKRNSYYRIVTDIRMPKVSGFELAKKIRGKDDEAQFCFLTSFEINQSEVKKVMPKLPSYCFVKKPITPNDLADHLTNHPEEIEFGE